MPVNTLVKKHRISEEQLDSMVNQIFGDESKYQEHLTESFIRMPSTLEPGTFVSGEVVSIKSDFLFIDFGHKSEGLLTYHEENSNNEDLDIGDKIELIIDKVDDKGNVFLSRNNISRVIKQRQVLDNVTVGDVVVGTLKDRTKQGWIVDLNDLPCLLPSHQEYLIYPDEGVEGLKNTEIEAVVESIDEMLITLTRKPYAPEIKRILKNKFYSSLEVGNIIEGVVKNVTSFGAFVQIASGVIGLCHSTDIGDKNLRIKQKIKTKVLKIDRENNRVFLGIRQVTEPTWDEVANKYSKGQVVKAKVKSLMPYGAFMEVESGFSGLIHISDLSWSDHIKHSKELLRIGEEVDVMILEIDKEKQHVSLGLKQINPDPWETIADRYLVGSVVPGKVANITHFGVFVTIEKGVEGLAHHTVNSRDLKNGQKVNVSILRMNPSMKRITLALED